MNVHHYSPTDRGQYPLCILAGQIRPDEIRRAYLTPFDLDPYDTCIMQLAYTPGKKKTPIKDIRRFLSEELIPALIENGVQYVLCSDADYFKELAQVNKAEAYSGYVLPNSNGFHVVYVPSFRSVFYDPVKVKSKIKQCIEAMIAHVKGEYVEPGLSIIEFEYYPRTVEDIKATLEELLKLNKPLTIDIEAFSLKFYEAGIGTISFCWSKTEGVAFPVDYQEIPGATEAPYGIQVKNEPVRALLKDFFIRLLQNSKYHNITFDVTVLIYQLFMDDICDIEGMQTGIDILLRDWDCTKLVTYLATNTCAGNNLGLKSQSQEYTGNYAMDDEDIKDIRKIPLPKLLRYNLVDGLATWYTYEKNYPIMVNDQQLPVYLEHFKPYAVDIIEMQLTGLPINMERTIEVDKEVKDLADSALRVIQNSPVVKRFLRIMAEKWAEKKNSEYKKKRVTPADFVGEFNPNSPDQMQGMLFDMLGLPVISYTKTKQPSTDADTIKALINHAVDPDVKDLLLAIQEYSLYMKLVTTFLPAMLSAQKGRDGWYYLFGHYNLGGALSGRLSSSEPNLQNLPVKGKLGKLIKSCFGCDPNGEWLFVGLDFASLEDRISALTTKDPNKLKVYTDGYDGHCLRAFSYFGDQMPDIVDTVQSINSIEWMYPVLRGESKAPTFALTYQGTKFTLMKNCGFSEEKAEMVESRYKALYKVSIEWVDAKLKQASKDGYITAAFGLRVRTPLLAQSIRGTSRTPYEVDAEGRSAGNALGQSWCLLNNRASAEFMGKVRKTEYRPRIRLSAHIHDAQYFRIKNDLETLMYVNEHLVKAVQWQDHPDIWHDQVKLGGELSVFYPDWNHEIGIPNYATEEQIISIVDAAMAA